MNPYAAQLGNRDPREVIADTPRQLAVLADRLGVPGMERATAPGKWPARAILCHLADCEVAFAFRLRQALAEPHHVIQPFDQEKWARPYSGLDGYQAVEAFAAFRRWNLALLQTLAPEDFARPVSHPERGTMTFQTLVETMAGHDLNHVRQLEFIAAQ